MELYLQFGWGMMEHCRSLINDWGGGCVILSPRDLSDGQLSSLARDIHELGGSVLLDPQFYMPNADHQRLVSHEYWPDDYHTDEFWSENQLYGLLQSLVELNLRLGSSAFILPGLYANHINDDWLNTLKITLEQSARFSEYEDRRIATIALSSDAVGNNDEIHRLLDEATRWDIYGVYLVCEHPKGDYLVADPNWIANVLDLVAGFHLRGKKVIVGYCNHQMLITASAGADAIASGTYMNVRSFPPSKFVAAYEEEIKTRATWYYCPQALSEYKVNFLDIAQRVGVLDKMKPMSGFGGGYADNLFNAHQPSLADFSEPQAFRHYLRSLHSQVELSRSDSFQLTVAGHEGLLSIAESLLAELHSSGIKGQLRDFREAIDANRAALAVLQADRGPVLRHRWQ